MACHWPDDEASAESGARQALDPAALLWRSFGPDTGTPESHRRHSRRKRSSSWRVVWSSGCGIRPSHPSGHPRRTGPVGRERLKVAVLVAEGKSSRLIAQELVVSERTVEAHIGNILAKLELTSRTQIATWAIGKGLVQAGAS